MCSKKIKTDNTFKPLDCSFPEVAQLCDCLILNLEKLSEALFKLRCNTFNEQTGQKYTLELNKCFEEFIPLCDRLIKTCAEEYWCDDVIDTRKNPYNILK